MIIKTIDDFSKTKKNIYLTGRTALNIPSAEETGDWNFYNYFLTTPANYYVASNTNSLWGNKGIYDAGKILTNLGIDINHIYAANHYRAIADLFYDAVENNQDIRYLMSATHDWLNTDKEKQKLFNFLRDLNNQQINEWIEHPGATEH
jgi:hypothetical protein